MHTHAACAPVAQSSAHPRAVAVRLCAGKVLKTFYTQSSFPEGQCVPYQVELIDGRKIYAPTDEERVIKAIGEGDLDESEGFVELSEAEKMPVTVVTGFLGAGKTTLVNYILREQHGKRICVIENEFGAVSIDEQLVKENVSVAEEIISMDNGCACCTVRGDLVKALDGLTKRRADFDLILIETTGLADPAPIIKTFTESDKLMAFFKIDGVLCLVDTKFALQHLNEKRAEDTVNEAVQQIAFADRVMLNKVDLVTKQELRTVKELVHSINSFAPMIECQQSKVPIDTICDVNSFNLERIESALDEYDFDDEEEEEDPHADEHCADESCGHDHGHSEKAEVHGHGHNEKSDSDGLCQVAEKEKAAHEHSHVQPTGSKKKKHDLSGVGSFALSSNQPIISAKFNTMMSNLLQYKAIDLYRCKGVFCFANEGNTKFVFQGVHEQIDFTESKVPWEEGVPRVSKVVFIGKDLDRAAIEAAWKGCMSTEE